MLIVTRSNVWFAAVISFVQNIEHAKGGLNLRVTRRHRRNDDTGSVRKCNGIVENDYAVFDMTANRHDSLACAS